MGKKDKQNAAESTPEKNTAQHPTADEAAKTAETAKADETAEKSAEPETFTVTGSSDRPSGRAMTVPGWTPASSRCLAMEASRTS